MFYYTIRSTMSQGKLILGGHAYSALVLPGVKRLPPETLEKILNLAGQGATLIVQGGWPSDVPGFFQQKEKRERLLAIETASTGKSTITHVQDSILPALASHGVLKETMTATPPLLISPRRFPHPVFLI